MGVRLDAIAPDLARGVRAAAATVPPFYLAGALERPELIWFALGGWLGSLADPDSRRSVRVKTVLAFALVGGTIVAAAAVVAAVPVLAGAMLVGTAFAGSLAGALGGHAKSVGTLVTVVAAIAVVSPGDPWVEAPWFAAGAVWAMLLAAIVWPVWPHLAVRRAVVKIYDGLAAYAAAVAGLSREAAAGDRAWNQVARVQQRSVRDAIEAARAAVVAVRSRRVGGESAVGANLRVLVGSSEAQLFALIALADRLEHSPTLDKPAAAAALDELARMYERLHVAVLWSGRKRGIGVPVAAVPKSRLAARLHALAHDDLVLAARLHHAPTRSAVDEAPASMTMRTLADALSPRSATFRHAVRVAAAALVAFVAARMVSPAHVSWVTVTAIAVLQPYPGATLTRAIERTVGTTIGGAIAMGLAMTVHEPLVLAVLLVPLSVAAVVTRPRSYRLFVVFLTPVFLLLSEPGQAGWWTAVARLGDVALGGAIAAGAAAAFGSWEHVRLGDALAAARRACERYVAVVFDAAARDRMAEARAEVGIALGAAELSLERMLAEPRPLQRGADEAVFAITYLRRLAQSLTALDEVLQARGEALPPALGHALKQQVTGAIGGATPAVPPFPDELPARSRSLLERVVQQAHLLAAAR